MAQQGLDLGSWAREAFSWEPSFGARAASATVSPEKALPWQRAKNQCSRGMGAHEAPRSFLTSAPRGACLPLLPGRQNPAVLTSFSVRRRKRWTLWGVRGCPGAWPAGPQGEGCHGCGCRRSPPQRDTIQRDLGAGETDNACRQVSPTLATPTGPHSPQALSAANGPYLSRTEARRGDARPTMLCCGGGGPRGVGAFS